MIIACPACGARFQYNEERFAGVYSKHFKCTKCSAAFEFLNPSSGKDDRVVSPRGNKNTGEASPGGRQAGFGSEANSASTSHIAWPGEAGYDAGAGQRGAGKAFVPQNRSEIRLVFLTGPNASMALSLMNPETIIGRDEGDIATMDPETSRRHARIEILGDGTVWLSDLGSKNGTLTNGRPIAGRVQLADRQEFMCGKSAFMLRFGGG